MDVAKMKDQARASWSKGEYSGLADMLRPAAVALVDACAVSAGQEVLDVAAGNGNFAVASASEGASVVATDIAPGMVEQGRRRTEEEGYDIEWAEADAEDLPIRGRALRLRGLGLRGHAHPTATGGGRGDVPGRASPATPSA